MDKIRREKLESEPEVQRVPKTAPGHEVVGQSIMVLACLFTISLLLLAPFPTKSEDVECQGVSEECIHYSKCQPYTRAIERKKTLEKPSCELKAARKRLKDALCNKADQKVCCGLCDFDQECVPQKDCPSFSEERRTLATLEKGSSEYESAEEKLKKRICDAASQSVCCEKPSQCNSDQAKTQSSSKQPEASKSCDPANGSCLPGRGRCGLAGSEQRVGFSVGGKDTKPGEFPFTALLGRKLKGGNLFRGSVYGYLFTCGGTLINLRYVVTGAHCHHPTKVRQQINMVRLGEYEVTDHKRRDCSVEFCLEDLQEFSIRPEDVTRHPDFQEGKGGPPINDIALIRLPEIASENLGVRVACLPIDPLVAARVLNVPGIGEGLASYYATMVGWGYTESGPDAKLEGKKEKVGTSIQQKLEVPVLSEYECSSRHIQPRPDQICAGGEKGKEFCAVSITIQPIFRASQAESVEADSLICVLRVILEVLCI